MTVGGEGGVCDARACVYGLSVRTCVTWDCSTHAGVYRVQEGERWEEEGGLLFTNDFIIGKLRKKNVLSARLARTVDNARR